MVDTFTAEVDCSQARLHNKDRCMSCNRDTKVRGTMWTISTSAADQITQYGNSFCYGKLTSDYQYKAN